FRVVGGLPELVGTHVAASLLPPLANQRMAMIEQALQTRIPKIYEQDLSTPNNTQVEEVRVVPYSADEVLLLVRDISERARLEAERQRLEAERQQAEDALQNLIAGTAATLGRDFFPALASHIAVTLDIAYAIVTEQIGSELRTLGFWANNALQPTYTYGLAHTPCERALQTGEFYCDSSVQQMFPLDVDLVEMGVESYLGIALQGSNGTVIGHLCILNPQPIADPQRAAQILRVFAARAAAELERQRATTSLEQLNHDLEAMVAERTAALQEREARYRALVEVMPDLLIRLHADGTYLDVVSGGEVTPFNPDRLYNGANIYDALPVDLAQLRMDYVQQALATQTVQVYDYELTIAGQRRAEEARIVAISAETVLVIVRDITARKQAEAELQAKTAEIQQAYQELKETQLQLIQSEKMSSLGQLVAGIAHEINNPVSFIYGNLAAAQTYTQDLKTMLRLYQDHYGTPPEAIAAFINAADIDYVLEDFPKLLKSMENGAVRIRDIVASLRTFSRLDQSDCKATDIHENIDSTLVILQNRLNGRAGKPPIQVIKRYGDLPAIECYSGLLNQVFMNLLVNAIDAVEERQSQALGNYGGCITIETRVTATDKVKIAIQDNGAGMDAATQAHIFDPFFTTKPIGVGTGMGLSISYQIVTGNHQGELSCASVLGKGTEFGLELWQVLPPASQTEPCL
ncbi:MAG: PAS domain-containing protein, partial [Leptolyngbya sp. RL_3_1]|nr:PAS domain-containing protein [Leptolyngbya sp. RL_3_1]